MRALIVYYSFTDQARIAAALMADVWQAAGMTTTMVRIDFADPAQRLTRPLPFSEQVRWGNLAERRQTLPIVYDKPEAFDAHYDFVCLISNTWKFHPSVPVQSFLKSAEAARVLDGARYAVVVVCRGFWRKNLRLVRKAATALGGRYIGGHGFGFAGSWLASTVQSVRYVAGAGDAQRRWGLLRLPPFGLSPAAQQQLRAFARLTITKIREL